MTDMPVMYAAHVSNWGEPYLMRLHGFRETPQTFTADSYDRIIGFGWINKRERKSEWHLTTNLYGAVTYLQTQMDACIAAQRVAFEQTMSKLEKNRDKVLALAETLPEPPA